MDEPTVIIPTPQKQPSWGSWFWVVLLSFCLVSAYRMERMSGLKQQGGRGMAIHSGNLMRVLESKLNAGQALEAHDLSVFHSVSVGYEELERLNGVHQDLIDYTVLLHALTKLSAGQKTQSYWRAKLEERKARLVNGKGLSIYGEEAVRVIHDKTFTTEEKDAMRKLARDWPRPWTIQYMLRESGAAEEVDVALWKDQQESIATRSAKLERLNQILFSAGLVSLLLIAFLPYDQPKGTNRRTLALQALWHPQKVYLCLVATSLLAWLLTVGLSGLLTQIESVNSQALVSCVGYAVILSLPLFWSFNVFVRNRRWYLLAIGLQMQDFRRPGVWCWGILGSLACVFLNDLLFRGLETVHIFDNPLDWISRSYEPWGDWSLFMSLFFGCILAPITEEILFRGFLFTSFLRRWGKVAAYSGSSLVFAVIHVFSFTGTIAVAISGLMFAWLFHKTGRLSVSIISHAILNAFFGVSDHLWMK